MNVVTASPGRLLIWNNLDVLERKPGALAGSKPLKQWRLAGRFSAFFFRRSMNRQKPGNQIGDSKFCAPDPSRVRHIQTSASRYLVILEFFEWCGEGDLNPQATHGIYKLLIPHSAKRPKTQGLGTIWAYRELE
jgi:hypothetical protein